MASSAVLVRAAEALEQIKQDAASNGTVTAPGDTSSPGRPASPGNGGSLVAPAKPTKPGRFYGSVEIDMVRPV
jgi:hypothetical protein